MWSLMHFQRYFSLKRNEKTLTVPSVIINSFPLACVASVSVEQRAKKRGFRSFVCFSFRGELENERKHFLYCGRFRAVLVAFTNTKMFIEDETKYTRPTTKEDFPGEVLSKQNI